MGGWEGNQNPEGVKYQRTQTGRVTSQGGNFFFFKDLSKLVLVAVNLEYHPLTLK